LISAMRPPFMEAFIELQRQLYQVAALAKTGSPNAGLLSDAEREDLQISVLVSGGSSDYRADLVEPARKLLNKMIGKMTGRQAAAVIIAFMFLVTGTYAFNDWLEKTKETKLEEVKSKDHQEALKAIEFTVGSDRNTIHEIIDVLKTQGEIGKQAIQAVTATNEALLKAAALNPKTVIKGTEITRQEAEVLRITPRHRAEPSAVVKLVKVVDINTSDPFDLAIMLIDVTTDAPYRIKFKDNLFAGQDRHKLFQALEDRQPIWAELSIKEVAGSVRSVELLRTREGPN